MDNNLPIKTKKKVKPAELLKMKHSGMTNSEIARATQTSPANITLRLRRLYNKLELLTDKDKLAEYKAKEVDILTALEYELVNDMLNPSARKQASVNNLAYAYGTIATHNRAKQGKSDNQSNTYIQIITQSANVLFPKVSNNNGLQSTSDKPSYVNLKGQEVSLDSVPDDRGGRGDMGKVAE